MVLLVTLELTDTSSTSSTSLTLQSVYSSRDIRLGKVLHKSSNSTELSLEVSLLPSYKSLLDSVMIFDSTEVVVNSMTSSGKEV